jgi:hypothetical protein
MYLTQVALHDAISDLGARLQVSDLRTLYPRPGHQELDICYVQANPARDQGRPPSERLTALLSLSSSVGQVGPSQLGHSAVAKVRHPRR